MANVAIYWDFENIHASLASLQLGRDWYRDNRFEKQPKLVDVAPIMEYAASLGNININRDYANWRQFVGYVADLDTHAIDLIQLYPRGSHGKNGADIRLATDVIEDIGRNPQIDTVLVVGGDSDVRRVLNALRRCKLFKFDSETGSLSLLPEVDSAATLAAYARRRLAQRIFDEISERPDAAHLATTLFGSASRKAEAQSLIDSLASGNGES